MSLDQGFIHIKYFLFLLVLVLCSFGCKTNRLALSQDESLRTALDKRIQCLNSYDFNCLSTFYTNDYKGWRPAQSFSDKEAFLKILHENFRKNQLQIKAVVEEINAGPQLGYVLMDWRMESTDEEQSVRVRQYNLEIWKKSKEGQWQLSRSLFYDRPEE